MRPVWRALPGSPPSQPAIAAAPIGLAAAFRRQMETPMFIRTSLIAALAAFGATLSAEPDLAGRAAGDAAGQEEAPASPARLRPGQTTRPPVVVGPLIAEATTSFSCTNPNGSVTTFTVSVEGGSCTTNGTSTTRPSAASCRAPNNQLAATANCAGGCGNSTGSGSCTQTTN